MTELEKQIAELKTIITQLDGEKEVARKALKIIESLQAELSAANEDITLLAEEISKSNAENKELKSKLEEAKGYIKNLGSIADVCTFRYTKEICEGCRCDKNKINGEKQWK